MARLGRPHGLEGFLGLYVEPEDLVHFEPGSVVEVEEQPLSIRLVRRGPRGYQIAFEGVTNRSAAEAIRNTDVYVSDRRVLADGDYWPEDLIGLNVRPGGGVVVGVVNGPAQDRLTIERAGATFEIPFVAELVPVIDIAGGYVEVVELEGLIPPSPG